jgi:Zn-dependent protease with chaperone function
MGRQLSHPRFRHVYALHLLGARQIAAVLGLFLLFLGGCAQVTRPTPTATEIEEAQISASRRYPYKNWSLDRASRVFIRLLATVPQTRGQSYPFLGFNWWITEKDRIVIDNVWQPSSAHDVGLRQGDIILGINNWPLEPWVAKWDERIRAVREVSQDIFWGQKRVRYGQRGFTPNLNLLAMPGEILVALMLDARNVAMETRGRYLSGPVEMTVLREGKELRFTLYPQHLPAEYAIMVDTSDRSLNAFAAPGLVILTSRLVTFCMNDDELALVEGHELAHQALGHLTRGAGQARLGGMAGKVWNLTGLFATQAIAKLANLGSAFWFKDSAPASVRNAVVSTFSRDDEREADIYGMWFAYQAGFDVERGVAVWERLGAVSHDPFQRTGFLDNHPPPMERLARLKIAARYFKAGQAAEVLLQSPALAAHLPQGK